MIILNFSHPLTELQKRQTEAFIGEEIERIHNIPVQFESEAPFLPQLEELMTSLNLAPQALQTQSIVVNPPALNFIAALVLADLHGRMGYFPPILRLRQVPDSLPPRYEVAEVLNLQAVRNHARRGRGEQQI
jgi:hypothetical protein